MKNKNTVSFGDSFSPVHDALVFEAEEYFKKHFKVSKVEYEVPVVTKNRFIIGYVDLLVTTDYDVYAVEVKPVINSFGELLRQINTYRSNRTINEFRKPTYCVYSHDKTFAEKLESQDISAHPKIYKRGAKKL